MRVALLFVLSSAAFAQTGAISGKIVDEFDIPVAGASVQAKDAAAKQFRAVSAASGEYTIDKLPPGVYEVTVAAATLNNFVKKDLVVAGTGASRLDVQMVNTVGLALGTLGDFDRYAVAALSQLGSAPPSGPVPRLMDGKPDLSGFWAQAPGQPPGARPEPVQPLPWAEEIRQERQASKIRDRPEARCLPSSIAARGQGRFVGSPSMLVMLYELDPPRQIYLDGRSHPQELNPTWQGHSVGHWEGDTLVVDTVGFNGLAWYGGGIPSTEMLHIVERYHRTDLGHMEAEIVIEDPAVLRKPWTQKRIYNLDLMETIQEYICNENEKDAAHMVAK
jgi:hypothetical protein